MSEEFDGPWPIAAIFVAKHEKKENKWSAKNIIFFIKKCFCDIFKCGTTHAIFFFTLEKYI